MKLLMLKGLPASGKSTYAKQLSDSKNYIRVNKDDLRQMLNNNLYTKHSEHLVLMVRDSIIKDALRIGKNVVVDDTNFNPIHETALRNIANEFMAIFEVKFFDTPLDECISRDLKRPNSVGEKVIRKMYNDYLRPVVEPIEYNPSLPRCILCDLDGTLAHMNGRGPYDTTGYLNDTLDKAVNSILVRSMVEVIFLSGRSSDFRAETVKWLDENGYDDMKLYMRASGDNRNDAIIKRELYETHIKPYYNVDFILDDRNRVVDMWRSLGLKCLQVAEGDF